MSAPKNPERPVLWKPFNDELWLDAIAERSAGRQSWTCPGCVGTRLALFERLLHAVDRVPCMVGDN